MELVFATRNKSKTEEATAVLKGLPLSVVDLTDLRRMQVDENGNTLAENAYRKAEFIYRHTPRPNRVFVGDDYGLFADSLNGLPGISPHRWTGKNRSYGKTNRALLAKMPEGATRRASMKVAISLLMPNDLRFDFVAGLEGEIAENAAKDVRTQYPFEQIFKPDGYDEVLAKLPPGTRWELSPRRIALTEARAVVESHLHLFK